MLLLPGFGQCDEHIEPVGIGKRPLSESI